MPSSALPQQSREVHPFVGVISTYTSHRITEFTLKSLVSSVWRVPNPRVNCCSTPVLPALILGLMRLSRDQVG